MSYKAMLGDREVTVLTSTLPYSAESVLGEVRPARLRAVIEQHREHTLWITQSLLGIEKIDCHCGSKLLVSAREDS